MINANNIQNPGHLEDGLPHSNVQNFQSYLQKQCYQGYKWTSSCTFKGSRDAEIFQEIYVLQCIGNQCYKDKEGREYYRVYFNLSKYPVMDELSKIPSLSEDTSLKVQTLNIFKSEAYNIVQNGNQKLFLKGSGLSVRNRVFMPNICDTQRQNHRHYWIQIVSKIHIP